MDLEKRLYDALKNHISKPSAPKPDLYRDPSVGILRETDSGPIWMVETVYDEGYLHGRTELSTTIPPASLPFIDPDLDHDNFEFTKIAVIDTETTGLAGGTGTYPFILGVGFFNNNKFIVRQYILRDFCEEPAQLAAFTDDIKDLNSILTYNGKSFDIPLLRTRYRINRMPIPFGKYQHLDLVHPCRRLFKNHYDSFQLSHLEAMVVGFERVDDVPSHLIPYIYFDFLRNRDDSLLLPILNHNRDDIVSLYLLAQETSRRIALALDNACEDDMFLLSLARLSFANRHFETAKQFLDMIKPDFIAPDIYDEYLSLKSSNAKKRFDWQEAEGLWREMLALGRFGCFPHVELAKHLEHRIKDYRQALDLTRAALLSAEFDSVSEIANENTVIALRRRQKRLISKIEKSAG